MLRCIMFDDLMALIEMFSGLLAVLAFNLLCVTEVELFDACDKSYENPYFGHTCDGVNMVDLWYCGFGQEHHFFSLTNETHCVSRENVDDPLQFILSNITLRGCGVVIPNGYKIDILLQTHPIYIKITDGTMSFNCTEGGPQTAMVRAQLQYCHNNVEKEPKPERPETVDTSIFYDEFNDPQDEVDFKPELQLLVVNSLGATVTKIENGDNISLLIDMSESTGNQITNTVSKLLVTNCTMDDSGNGENIIMNGCGTGVLLPLESRFNPPSGLQMQSPMFSVSNLSLFTIMEFACDLVWCKLGQTCSLDCSNGSLDIAENAQKINVKKSIIVTTTSFDNKVQPQSDISSPPQQTEKSQVQHREKDYIKLEEVFRVPLIMVIVVLGILILVFCFLVMCLICQMRKNNRGDNHQSPYSTRSSDVLLANDNWRIGATAAPKARHVFGINDDNIDNHDMDPRFVLQGIDNPAAQQVGFQSDCGREEMSMPNPTRRLSQLEGPGASCRL